MTAHVREPFTIKQLAEKASEESEVPITVAQADEMVAWLVMVRALEPAGMIGDEMTFWTPRDGPRSIPTIHPVRVWKLLQEGS